MRHGKPERAQFSDNQINVKVVTSLEELSHLFAVRAICFLEEHNLPLGQTYDGNDFQATHVLLRCDETPIGCIRIRWFKEFAQFDRTAVRPGYRYGRGLHRMAAFAFEHVARKGYTRIVTHAAPVEARLWRRMFGFKPVPNRPTLQFKDYPESIELELELPRSAEVIDRDSPPAVIHRVEGHWDQPSTFERIANEY